MGTQRMSAQKCTVSRLRYSKLHIKTSVVRATGLAIFMHMFIVSEISSTNSASVKIARYFGRRHVVVSLIASQPL